MTMVRKIKRSQSNENLRDPREVCSLAYNVNSAFFINFIIVALTLFSYPNLLRIISKIHPTGFSQDPTCGIYILIRHPDDVVP
jgi:hypothetical protein